MNFMADFNSGKKGFQGYHIHLCATGWASRYIIKRCIYIFIPNHWGRQRASSGKHHDPSMPLLLPRLSQLFTHKNPDYGHSL